MFKTRMIVLINVQNVDILMLLAAKYNLKCLHKIGIYGAIQQHELFVTGWIFNYLKFRKEAKNMSI